MADRDRPIPDSSPPAEDMHWGINYLREDLQDIRLDIREIRVEMQARFAEVQGRSGDMQGQFGEMQGRHCGDPERYREDARADWGDARADWRYAGTAWRPEEANGLSFPLDPRVHGHPGRHKRSIHDSVDEAVKTPLRATTKAFPLNERCSLSCSAFRFSTATLPWSLLTSPLFALVLSYVDYARLSRTTIRT